MYLEALDTVYVEHLLSNEAKENTLNDGKRALTLTS
jgi:hypothetical protein